MNDIPRPTLIRYWGSVLAGHGVAVVLLHEAVCLDLEGVHGEVVPPIGIRAVLVEESAVRVERCTSLDALIGYANTSDSR